MGLDSEHLGTQKPSARARTAGERSAGPGDDLRGGGRGAEGAAASGNPCSPPCLPPPPGGAGRPDGSATVRSNAFCQSCLLSPEPE